MLLTKHYGIPVAPFPPPEVPRDPTLAFLRTGYGECLDSFFAFGLFRLGERAQLFPKALIDVFEQIMQEEARHILFIVNWAAYLRARRPLALRPGFDLWRGWNIVAQAFDRLKGALAMAGGDGKKGEKKDAETRPRRRPGRIHAEVPLDVRRLLPARLPRDVPRGEHRSASRSTTRACCARCSCRRW